MWVFFRFPGRASNKASVSIKSKLFSSPTKAIHNDLFIVYCSACSAVWKQIKNNAHSNYPSRLGCVSCYMLLIVYKKRCISDWTSGPHIVLIKRLIKKQQSWKCSHFLVDAYPFRLIQPTLSPTSKCKHDKKENNYTKAVWTPRTVPAYNTQMPLLSGRTLPTQLHSLKSAVSLWARGSAQSCLCGNCHSLSPSLLSYPSPSFPSSRLCAFLSSSYPLRNRILWWRCVYSKWDIVGRGSSSLQRCFHCDLGLSNK